MKIFLRDKNREIVDAWESVFWDNKDVNISCGDIFGIKADAIISPANSFGFMDGGIDFEYSKYFGWDLEKKLQEKIRKEYFGEIPVGTATIIKTDNEHIKYLISAPTMRIPDIVSHTVNAYLAFRASLIEVLKFNSANDKKISSILCPGLCTYVGQMPAKVCAVQMKNAYDAIVKKNIPFPSNLEEAYSRHQYLNKNKKLL